MREGSVRKKSETKMDAEVIRKGGKRRKKKA